MKGLEYISILVEVIHSTTIATIGADGHPQTRVIDMMLYDDNGVYFLTAKGKTFYEQLMEQQFIAVSATKDKVAVSLRGKKLVKIDRFYPSSKLCSCCGRVKEELKLSERINICVWCVGLFVVAVVETKGDALLHVYMCGGAVG